MEFSEVLGKHVKVKSHYEPALLKDYVERVGFITNQNEMDDGIMFYRITFTDQVDDWFTEDQFEFVD
ncbi:hypothetical protein [Aquibacillus saliphilus]|uniref:hypothetical protein n=1 Tax=Aquibacillus saliphilus TaxID=1909422 RepID=UPI001CF0AE74|nr:hypothetical protein [Aquibacillus saliphilus]